MPSFACRFLQDPDKEATEENECMISELVGEGVRGVARQMHVRACNTNKDNLTFNKQSAIMEEVRGVLVGLAGLQRSDVLFMRTHYSALDAATKMKFSQARVIRRSLEKPRSLYAGENHRTLLEVLAATAAIEDGSEKAELDFFFCGVHGISKIFLPASAAERGKQRV